MVWGKVIQLFQKPRTVPRKVVHAAGMVLINGHEFSFTTEDLSVEGAKLKIDGEVEAPQGLEVELSIDDIDIAARGKVCWSNVEGSNCTFLGLEFSEIEGIAGVDRLLQNA